jgi:redox-regulated HSP33 family molecular chaperone
MLLQNKMMKGRYDMKGFNFELLDGEYRRYVDSDGTQSAEYLCVGVFEGNRILFQYVDTTNEVVDYVQYVVENIPEFAFDYLIGVLKNNHNVLVRLAVAPTLPTSFEIYYNCDCQSNEISDIIVWMGENNDFAAEEFRYTEIKDGHQKCVGE